MNEFTKEELKFIHRSLEQLKWHKSSYFMIKIQSMIDNYCEHREEIKESFYVENKCDKCSQIIFGQFPCPCTLS
jgi:hypothetical protein